MFLSYMVARAHLTGVEPVFESLLVTEVRQDESEESVLPQQSKQSTCHPYAQQHKQPREMLDTHLQSLGTHTQQLIKTHKHRREDQSILQLW